MSTITVTNTNDSGAGSLRAALASAGSGDTITFDAGLSGQVIRLTTGYMTANAVVTIDGDLDNDGRPDITITGDKNGDDILVAGTNITDIAASLAAGKLGDNSSVIYSPHNITIDGLILTGGNSSVTSGSGILTTASLTLSHSIVAGNRATSGGGVGVGGNATISDSVIYGNVAINTTGGILAIGTATLTNTTVYGNSSVGPFGGVHANGNNTLINSTVTGNEGSGGASTTRT